MPWSILTVGRFNHGGLSAALAAVVRAGCAYRTGNAALATLMVVRHAIRRSFEHGVAHERHRLTDPIKITRELALLIALANLMVHSAGAQTVVDANTVKLDGMTYRLWGIDAPEREQTCNHDWPAGVQAMSTLIELMQGKKVECDERGHDRDGLAMAVCRADGADLGAGMVRAGMAWADLTVSHVYVLQEARAADYKGVHAYQCKTAWEWRASNHPSSNHLRQ